MCYNEEHIFDSCFRKLANLRHAGTAIFFDEHNFLPWRSLLASLISLEKRFQPAVADCDDRFVGNVSIG